MNIQYIQVGQWFKIDCQGSPEVEYNGIGMVTKFNPEGYPENTFEVLRLDGEFGYFTSDQFFTKVPLPDNITLNTILLQLAQNC